MKCIFCFDELIETPNIDWSDYYCKNCLCSYEGKSSFNTIYFDFNSNLELNVPLDGILIDNYPINIQFLVKNNTIVYNDWISDIYQYIENMKISSAEEAKDLVKRLQNLKLFI